MALCPNCYAILNFWNFKAECPHCGVNIPNFNWEGRLDEDAKNAEVAWGKFRKFTGNFKSALFGNKVRILRFVCTFLPLIALVLPLANYSITLPFLSRSQQSFTLLDFTLNKFLTVNWGAIINLAFTDNLGTASLMLILSVFLLYLAVVFGVLNFIFVLIKAPSLKAGANIVLCVLSDICFILPGIFFTAATSIIGNSSAAFINGNIQFGLLVGIVLFSLNVVLNTIVNKSMKKERSAQK